MKKPKSSDPVVHCRHITHVLHELKNHCREDVTLVKDPQARALFETTAEVLNDLEKALIDYQIKKEESWKDSNNLAESWGE